MSIIKKSNKLRRFKEEGYSIRFLISRVLPLLGLSKYFYIERPGYVLRFFPTALSASIWYQPDCRNADLDFIVNNLAVGDVYVDVGSNIGDLALCAYNKVKPNGKVIAIEAHPLIFSYLEENIKINKASIIAKQVAISDCNGMIGMSDIASDDQNFISENGEIVVELTTLDDILANINEINLLKIDIEGFEYKALRGATEVLKRTKMLIIEVWDQHLSRSGCKWENIYTLLTDMGFVIYDNKKNIVTKSKTFPICVDLIVVNEKI
jgi:FkbM family methyltransferase